MDDLDTNFTNVHERFEPRITRIRRIVSTCCVYPCHPRHLWLSAHSWQFVQLVSLFHGWWSEVVSLYGKPAAKAGWNARWDARRLSMIIFEKPAVAVITDYPARLRRNRSWARENTRMNANRKGQTRIALIHTNDSSVSGNWCNSCLHWDDSRQLVWFAGRKNLRKTRQI